MAMRRMWAMIRVRSSSVRRESRSKASRAAATASFDVGKQAEPALVAAAGRRVPLPLLPSRVSTCSTTLRINVSSTCMTLQLRRWSVQCEAATSARQSESPIPVRSSLSYTHA